MQNNIIFILPNIYDHVSGVSNKYTSFIHYLSQKNNIKITLFNISKNIPQNLHNTSFYKTSSVSLPLYNAVSIPIFTHSHLQNIIDQNKKYRNIIIFNSEFIWLHPILIHIKKKNANSNVNITLIPNMHTDIDYYIKEYLSGIPLISNMGFQLGNFVDTYLTEKKFDKIIVTGNILYKKYNKICRSESGDKRVLNVNEIDYDNFAPYHKPLQFRRDYIWKNGAFVNIIYCGRLSIEKNIHIVFDLSDYLVNVYLQGDYSKVNLHIIGNGPHKDELENYVKQKYRALRVNFHGSKNHTYIAQFYQNVYNPIFLFCSSSETFGKTGIEATVCGIPLFHIESDISKEILTNKKNSFLFKNKSEFVNLFDYYMNMKYTQLVEMNNYTQDWVKQYDQKVIFQKWYEFINE